MANAKRCDRCGLFFDPLKIDHLMCRFRNPAFFSKEDTEQSKVGSYLLMHEPADAIVDLCPKCAEDFELFMNNMPLAIYNDPPMCEKDEDARSNWVKGYEHVKKPAVIAPVVKIGDKNTSTVLEQMTPPEHFRDISSIDNR